MPPKLTLSVPFKLRFIRSAQRRGAVFAEVCRRAKIAEKTGYKWLNRFTASGVAGLEELSRAPKSQPHQTSADAEAWIVAAALVLRPWGPRKIRDVLALHFPHRRWPAVSTTSDILSRNELTDHRPARRRRARTFEAAPIDGPNSTWCADHKGPFRLRNRRWCWPLTVTDAFSRYLIVCDALPSLSEQPNRAAFETAFRRHGLPRVIRTDNGIPFVAPNSGVGLTAISVWWLDLGIRHERIDPGVPQQNGQEERFHGTLVREVLHTIASTHRAQQRDFDDYKPLYNELRGHESLQMRRPADVYVRSAREMPNRIRPPEYDEKDVRLVASNGTIRWRNLVYFLSKALAGRHVSLTQTADGVQTVRYRSFQVGTLDERHKRVRPG